MGMWDDDIDCRAREALFGHQERGYVAEGNLRFYPDEKIVLAPSIVVLQDALSKPKLKLGLNSEWHFWTHGSHDWRIYSLRYQCWPSCDVPDLASCKAKWGNRMFSSLIDEWLLRFCSDIMLGYEMFMKCALARQRTPHLLVFTSWLKNVQWHSIQSLPVPHHKQSQRLSWPLSCILVLWLVNHINVSTCSSSSNKLLDLLHACMQMMISPAYFNCSPSLHERFFASLWKIFHLSEVRHHAVQCTMYTTCLSHLSRRIDVITVEDRCWKCIFLQHVILLQRHRLHELSHAHYLPENRKDKPRSSNYTCLACQAGIRLIEEIINMFPWAVPALLASIPLTNNLLH